MTNNLAIGAVIFQLLLRSCTAAGQLLRSSRSQVVSRRLTPLDVEVVCQSSFGRLSATLRATSSITTIPHDANLRFCLSTLFQLHESTLGAVSGAFLVYLCEGRGGSDLDLLSEYVVQLDNDPLQPEWRATERFQVRRPNRSLLLLYLDNTTPMAVQDLLGIEAVCKISG